MPTCVWLLVAIPLRLSSDCPAARLSLVWRNGAGQIVALLIFLVDLAKMGVKDFQRARG